MNKKMLNKYAKLIVKVGVNVQEGQDVIIRASIDQSALVTEVVRECYKAKARQVTIDWNMLPEVKKLKYDNESVETLGDVTTWEVEKLKYQVEKNPARIHIVSEDPDAMKGLNQAKVAEVSRKTYPITKPFIDQMDNHYQWTIVGAASPAWAKKVFKGMSTKAAVNKLWDAIFTTARLSSNPIDAWNKHNENLLNKCNHLNSLNLDYLHYTSSNGTDFKVWMLDKCKWLGGGETSLRGVYYNPNMPTEECFITPVKGKAIGKVVATKPLSYNGELIEDFTITFKDGKVVDCTASKNLDLLKKMISMDEGASYLGECALVPFESPVNQTNVLFYNTLFDENAVCHLALGRGFPECVKDYAKYTKKDFDEMGINDSMIHVDFMIGSSDLNIEGVTKDGKHIQIFKDGTWAF